jgi:hypothetical protein
MGHLGLGKSDEEARQSIFNLKIAAAGHGMDLVFEWMQLYELSKISIQLFRILWTTVKRGVVMMEGVGFLDLTFT